MRLLVIPSWYPPDGGMFFVHQTQWLADEGIAAAVVVAEERSLKAMRPGTLQADLRISRKEEYGLLTYRKVQFRIPKWNRQNTKNWISTALEITERYIKDNGKPDLIQAHSSMWAGYTAALIRKRHGIPYVISEHRGRFNENNFFRQREILTWHKPLLKEALVNADAIIPVSERLVPVLESIAGRKLPCWPIPNPVDEQLFVPADSQPGSPDHTVFLNITNFQAYKATDVLVDAFYRALRHRDDIRLRIAGEGRGRSNIESYVKKLGLADRVSFEGYQTPLEIRNLFGASDFLVCSSYNEGQPVSVGEAALCGKPVIGTDVLSAKDVPGFAGCIVKTGSAEALAEAMLQAMAQKKSYDPMVIRNFALDHYARRAVIARIMKVFTSVVHSTTP